MTTLIEKMQSLRQQFEELQTQFNELTTKRELAVKAIDDLDVKREAAVKQLADIDEYLHGASVSQAKVPKPKAKQAPIPKTNPRQAPVTTTRPGVSEAVRQALAGGKTLSAREICKAMREEGFMWKGKRPLYAAVVDACKNQAAKNVGLLIRSGPKFKPCFSLGRKPVHPSDKARMVKVKKYPKPEPVACTFPHPVPKAVFTDLKAAPKPDANHRRKDECVNAVLESVRLLTGLNGDQWVRVHQVKDLLDKDGIVLKGIKDPCKKIHNVLYRLGMSGRLERSLDQKGYRLPVTDRK